MSAEYYSNQEVSANRHNRDNLSIIHGGHKRRSGIFVKFHYNDIWLVLNRAGFRYPGYIIYYIASVVIEANLLPQVIHQYQTGIDIYRNILHKITRLIIEGSCRIDANISCHNLDNRPAQAVEVIVIIFVHLILHNIYP